jgi:uracil-DNA glycosylase family 4
MGSGDLEKSKMMLVGEAPGEVEVSCRPMKPFIGGSGRLLTALLQQAGINRNSETYLTNVVKCRPPGNRTPTDEEIACCSPILKEEISRSGANVIIALGDTPLRALTAQKGISNHRGVARKGVGIAEGKKIFPTWHPAFIIRQQFNWPFAVHDLSRARAQSEFPELRPAKYEVVRNASEAVDGPDLLSAARKRGAVTFDFETTGLSGKTARVVMVGLAAGPDKAHVFTWSPGSQQLLQALLDDPEIEICGQNILAFDYVFGEEAEKLDISKAWLKTFDTMVTFHLCNSSYGQTSIFEQQQGTYRQQGMQKDLTMIASCHTDMEYWKDRGSYQGDLRGVCAKDCIATDRSAYGPSGIKRELELYGMTDLYYKHVLPIHPVLHKMTKLGFKIDEEQAARWHIALNNAADKLEAEFKEYVGDPHFNLRSSKQMQELLYVKLKLPVQYAGKNEGKLTRPTANHEAIEDLTRMFPEHEVLTKVSEIRRCRTLDSTFVEPMMLAGRMHPRFGGSKTSSGRLNSWQPNAQNIPEVLRDLWIPDDKEHVILAADWSQIEWRLSMVLSGDAVGLEMLSSGVDSHKAVAATVLSKRIEDVTPDERQAAKFIVYGLGYGRGAASLAGGHRIGSRDRRVGVEAFSFDVKTVEKFITKFLYDFRGFAAWRDEIVRFVKDNNYYSNPFGRRRWWWGFDLASTEIYSMPPQSTAADMMYEAIRKVDAQLPEGATLRLTVHDELVACVAKDVAKEAFSVMKGVMTQTWPKIQDASFNVENVRKFYPNGWTCPVDIHFGENWKQAKSKEKPDIERRTELERELGITGKE